MPSKLDDTSNLNFLYACPESAQPSRIDYLEVAKKFGIQTPAARIRLHRLREEPDGGNAWKLLPEAEVHGPSNEDQKHVYGRGGFAQSAEMLPLIAPAYQGILQPQLQAPLQDAALSDSVKREYARPSEHVTMPQPAYPQVDPVRHSLYA
jgi:hypothetical protein